MTFQYAPPKAAEKLLAPRARELMLRFAEADWPDFQLSVGLAYLHGTHGFVQNVTEGNAWIAKAAGQKHQPALELYAAEAQKKLMGIGQPANLQNGWADLAAARQAGCVAAEALHALLCTFRLGGYYDPKVHTSKYPQWWITKESLRRRAALKPKKPQPSPAVTALSAPVHWMARLKTTVKSFFTTLYTFRLI
jgi:hypothetical protein